MIFLKNKNEIKDIDRACKIVRDTLFYIEEYVVPDVTSLDLDRMAEEFIISKGAIPGFKGLYGFPNTLCVSIEDEVVHGIPSNRRLKDGEIVGIDHVREYYLDLLLANDLVDDLNLNIRIWSKE